jgi:isoquinoline 1-oxidoreductase beta subunit
MTGGSTSIASEWERFRKAGAAAREMLLAAAADVWKVDRASLRAESGAVLGPGGRRLTYGQLVERAATMPVPADPPLKPPSEWKLIGKATRRLDSRVKVTGEATFGMDTTLPGMLTAVVARPPVFGATVKQVDADRARAVPGVKAVAQIPSGVAVIATSFWAAKRGRDALRVTWEEGEGARVDTSALEAEYARLAKTPGRSVRRGGDPDQALTGASTQLAATYQAPYLAHAPMEPLNCLVALGGGRCEIWTGTQFQTVDRMNAAGAAGLKPEQVEIHTLFLGGGFGRRAVPNSDFIVEAVHVAKAGGGPPVKTVWTREDDLQGGYYRPMWHSAIAAGLDASGAPVAWTHTIVGQSILTGTPFEAALVKDGIDATSVEGAAEIPYAVPNVQVSLHSPKGVVPVLWWRSVGHTHTGYVVESFIDECAHAAGKDPYQYRRALLARHPRHLGVLDLAAQKAAWGTPPPPGRARGIAVHESFGSWCAQVAEVSVQERVVRVHRVVCAIDCGRPVNPETIRAQLEGGVVFGLSAALYGQITIREGRVQQRNFHQYPVLRIDQMPEVEVHIVPSTEPPSGVGEPGTPLMAAAVCNALFALTGTRIRSLPLTRHGYESA